MHLAARNNPLVKNMILRKLYPDRVSKEISKKPAAEGDEPFLEKDIMAIYNKISAKFTRT